MLTRRRFDVDSMLYAFVFAACIFYAKYSNSLRKDSQYLSVFIYDVCLRDVNNMNMLLLTGCYISPGIYMHIHCKFKP